MTAMRFNNTFGKKNKTKKNSRVNQNKKIKKSPGIKGLKNKHWEETKVPTGED